MKNRHADQGCIEYDLVRKCLIVEVTIVVPKYLIQQAKYCSEVNEKPKPDDYLSQICPASVEDDNCGSYSCNDDDDTNDD